MLLIALVKFLLIQIEKGCFFVDILCFKFCNLEYFSLNIFKLIPVLISYLDSYSLMTSTRIESISKIKRSSGLKKWLEIQLVSVVSKREEIIGLVAAVVISRWATSLAYNEITEASISRSRVRKKACCQEKKAVFQLMIYTVSNLCSSDPLAWAYKV